MKKIIFIIAIMAFVGCKEEAPTQNSTLSIEESYFPLQVGNEWIYNYHFGNTDTTKYIKVIGTKNINNNDYFIVVDNIHFESDTNYIRTDDGTKYYLYKENKDYIYRFFKDTTIKSDDIYNSQELKSKYQSESINTVKTEIENYNSYMEVEEGTIENDGGTMFYYVESIGLVYSFWFKGKITLFYAKVNDVEYGDK